MEFIIEDDRIYWEDESGTLLAELTFPEIGPELVNIDHTFVDGSLRGKGVADELMKAAVMELRARGAKARLTCPYAKRWFAEHPEESDLISKGQE